MLVLSRKSGERIVIGANIELKVMSLSKSRVRLAIDAPQEIAIYRQELRQRIHEVVRNEANRDGQPGT
jgi:carbon storage regulator